MDEMSRSVKKRRFREIKSLLPGDE